MKRWLYVFAICLALFALPARAEDGGYFDADYPFAELQRIEVHVRIDPAITHQDLYAPLIHDFPMQIVDKLTAKKFIVGAPLIPVSASSPAEADAADVQTVLDVQVHRLETYPVVSAGYTDWRPRITYLPVYDKEGHLVDYEPYVDYIPYATPPRRSLQHLIGVTYTLYDATDGREISRYSYLRSGSASPSTLARKTAGAYASRLAKVRDRH